MTTIDLQYPVRYCYFCDNLMFYNRYENGEHYAYCNHPLHASCMGFSYRIVDSAVKIKEFTISHTDILYYTVKSDKDSDGTKTKLLVANPEGEPNSIVNLFKTDLQAILNKEASVKLLEKIRKAVLLLD